MKLARTNDWRGLVDEIRKKAADGCEGLTRELLGDPNPTLSSRRELRWGTHGKIALQLDGEKRGQWFDFSTYKGGDIIDLVREVRGGSFAEVIGWLCDELNLSERYHLLRHNPRDSHVESLMTSATVEKRSTGPPDTSPLAARIWRESLDPHGTFAEEYLAARGLRLPEADALRFHPRCTWGTEQTPALVAAFMPILSDVPNDPLEDPHVTAIHRIRGRGHGNKKMLGPVAGQAIMLSPWCSVHDTLHVCEGLETAIALYAEGDRGGVDDPDAWQFDGLAHRPVWALGSAGAIGNLPVIKRVRRLIIWADNDNSGTGVRNARQCAERWADSGRDVVIRYPEETGTDYADLAARRSAAGAFSHG